MSQVIICDRCRRDVRTIPDVLANAYDPGAEIWLSKLSITMPGGKVLDLCGECFAACLAWVALGTEE